MDSNNKMIKQALHTIWGGVIKCFKGIGGFLQKRWKILLGVVAGIALVIAGVAWYDHYKQVTLPFKKQSKAVDRVESSLHSDDPNVRKLCAYEILFKKDSDNASDSTDYIHKEEITFGVVKERFSSLMQEAFNYIRDEAFAGEARCQYYLGNLYFFQEDYVENDDTKAAYWWNEAAQRGYIDAYNKIGCAYKQGLGVHKNMKLAVDWLKKGAEAGESYAQYNYGAFYRDGANFNGEILLPQDIEQAKFWWRKSAEQGNTLAIDALQKIYD